MENLLTMASSFLSSNLPLSKSLRNVLLHIVRYFLVLSLSSIFFFLRILLSLFPFLTSTVYLNRPEKGEEEEISGEGDSGIARALSQMLSIVNEIPVSSRKYETVRGLAEKVMNENVREESAEVNRTVLLVAFSRAMGLLEEVMWGRTDGSRDVVGLGKWRLRRVGRVVRKIRAMAGWEIGIGSGSPEKLAAELLWMARKMVDCGAGEEAISMWASASSLASMAVAAEASLQGSLVKVSAFLFKRAREVEEAEHICMEQGVKLKMLMSWLPLLCHASNGTDSPVMTSCERAEMETLLEEMIEKLSNSQQEKVLALWLYHFTCCSNSDWPNLQACYARWYSASRKLSLLK